MADMRKAGLNPLLAYKMGGASSPIGSMSVHPSTGDVIGSATRGVQAHSGRTQAKASTKQATTAQGLATSTRAKLHTASGVDIANTAKIGAETATAQQQARLTGAQADIAQYNSVSSALDAQIAASEMGIAARKLGIWTKQLPSIMPMFGIGRGAGKRGGGKKLVKPSRHRNINERIYNR